MHHSFSHSNQAAGTHQTPHRLAPEFGHHLFIQVYILLVALQTMTNALAPAAPGALFAPPAGAHRLWPHNHAHLSLRGQFHAAPRAGARVPHHLDCAIFAEH